MAEHQSGNASMVRMETMIQIARGLAEDRSDPNRPYRDARISLGTVKDGQYLAALSFATGTPDLAYAVSRCEIDLAAINPSAFLSMAYRGTGPFRGPLPVRTVAVMPSWDRMGFAMSERAGIRTLAEVRERNYPLRISLRANPAHATRFLIDQVLDAAGFTLKDIEAWGGSLHYVDTPSHPSRLDGIRNGSVDAVFDEGIKGWGPLALQAGFQLLPLEEPVMARLKSLGWPVGPILVGRLAGLTSEVAAPSFSGWPIFTRADMPDDVVYKMCASLDAARPQIAWDYDGEVQLGDLCSDADAAPLGAPLHPGAASYYRERGALR